MYSNFQDGGQQEQIMQILKAYAQLSQVDPNKLIQQLQQLNPEEQQAAIEQMANALQSEPEMGSSQMSFGGYMPEAPYMKNGGSTFSGNAFYNKGGFVPTYNTGGMPCYDCGGSYGNMFQDGGQQWHSEWNQDAYAPTESMDPETQYVQNLYAQEQAQGLPAMNVAKSSTPKSLPNKKANGSIVDYLNSQGVKSDYASRKAMAQEYGIINYTGKADQNEEILRRRTNESQGSNQQSYNPNDGNILRQTVYNPPFVNEETASQYTGFNPLFMAAGVGTVAATAGLTAAELVSKDFEKLASTKGFPPAVKAKLTKARKKLIDAAMRETGKGAAEAISEFKNSPKKLQKILDNLDRMEIPGEIYQTRSGTGMRNIQAWNMAKETQAEDMLMSNLQSQKMLDESAQEAAAFRSASAQRAAATRAANKAAASGKTAAVVSQEARPWYNAIREGYAAAKATPLLKFLRKQDGGEPDSFGEDVLEFFDPTGISSYDDTYRAWNNPNMPMWEKALITSTALPVVGKFGKAAKAATGFKKAMNIAGKVITPVAQMDKYLNPMSRAVASSNAKLLENAPRAVKGLASFGNMSNQSGRFWTGADRLMGQSTKQKGGYVEGQEMDVTPEQLEMLRAQGYQFEIL